MLLVLFIPDKFSKVIVITSVIFIISVINVVTFRSKLSFTKLNQKKRK